jgi:hypothetical protein
MVIRGREEKAMRSFASMLVMAAIALLPAPIFSGDKAGGVTIDTAKRLIKIDAKIAPRKLPKLDKVYPIEVIACWPHPKGQKAHETVVVIDAKPSEVHKALEGLGLKPGKPVMGGKDAPQGPRVSIYLEVPEVDGAVKRITMDKALIDSRTSKPFPKNTEWRFTGSVMSKPDPTKNETVYGADVSGTLIAIFPVTDQTVLQTNYSMEYEGIMKLETNTKALPAEGMAVKLVIEVPAK